MPDTQVIVRVPDFVTQGCVLPETFLQWQIEARQAMLEAIASGGHPRRFAAHLPVMITFEADGPFPVRVATKGAGLTPRDEALDRYVAILEDALARCDGRSWEATITDRVTAARALLDHLEDIDRRRLGFLEIFRGGTYDNLQHDSRVVLHYTGDGPNYPSFQINGYAEILDQDDPRYRYIALARRIFEDAPFHLQQPGYVCGYLVWVHEVLDKTPHSLALGTTKGERPTLALSEAEGTNEHSSFVVRRSSARETSPAVTFREVLVPLDNSRYSAWAIEVALQIAGAFGSTVVGNHVYAARLHDRRFRDMEPGLPEEYRAPIVLAHQRQLHDTLIEKGLKLISDSYLEALKQRCQQAGLRFMGKTPEGKNYAELVRDIKASRYDLVVMGAWGQGGRGAGERRGGGAGERGGRGDGSPQHPSTSAPLLNVGSVCERVVRRTARDVLVIKNDRPLGGVFVVGIDGSERSFAALRVALALAEATGARVQAVAAYDPFLHKALFHELEDALTEEAKQVFNTEQQKKLHDTLIDSGIAKIYGDHLETARRIAAEACPACPGRQARERSQRAGAEIETHLLVGKPYAAILRHIAEVQPTLLALGRTGVHADEGLDIGSNAENLLRLAPCHVLLVGRPLAPTRAETREVIEEHLPWTAEAVARLERIPAFARGMARQAIEDYARQQGLTVVDEQVMLEARARMGMG